MEIKPLRVVVPLWVPLPQGCSLPIIQHRVALLSQDSRGAWYLHPCERGSGP
jgi:hypothetical protein